LFLKNESIVHLKTFKKPHATPKTKGKINWPNPFEFPLKKSFLVYYTMKKWGDLQLDLQLNFWIATTISNPLQLNVFPQTWVLLDKLHELQHMQFIVCETIYICNSCNSITSMYEQLLCNSNVTSLQLQW
jgi:hypothetical protein